MRLGVRTISFDMNPLNSNFSRYQLGNPIVTPSPAIFNNLVQYSFKLITSVLVASILNGKMAF